MNRNTGIVILATNAYFVLGVKFIKRFMHFHTGDDHIKFYFFSDTDPHDYLPGDVDVVFTHTSHDDWVDATNSKFTNILSIDNSCDYVYYFDADTSVGKQFTCDWMIGDLVGGEHYANRGWMKDKKGFERDSRSKSYVPLDTTLEQTYYYGAFFGGTTSNMKQFCETMLEWQTIDKQIPFEPGCNDESYINAYFHYNPPHTVQTEDFMFNVSDKSGIGETRNTELDIGKLKHELLLAKDSLIDIRNGVLYRDENT
jgi:hypothetical protein